MREGKQYFNKAKKERETKKRRNWVEILEREKDDDLVTETHQ